MFQAALASLFFFSPEKQTSAGSVAAAFAVLLLPYSLVGPFAGVLLDRWRRRQVLVVRQPAARRAWSSASRRSVAARRHRPTALRAPCSRACRSTASSSPGCPPRCHTSSTATSWSWPTRVSHDQRHDRRDPRRAASASGCKRLFGDGDAADAQVIVVAALVYAVRGAVAPRHGPRPARPRPRRRAAADPGSGTPGRARPGRRRAARVATDRPAATRSTAIGAHRFFYGVSTITAILLFRYYFNDPTTSTPGLAGLAGGVRGLRGRLLPRRADHAGGHPPGRRKATWITVCFALGRRSPRRCSSSCSPSGLLSSAPSSSASPPRARRSASTRSCRTSVDDAYRGRVFSFYDVVFNVAFVAAAAFAAAVLPADGNSRIVFAVVAVGYAVTAAAYARATRRLAARTESARRADPATSPS